MSELNDLIHTNAQHAFAIGVKTERERIIKLLTETKIVTADQKFFLTQSIKGEQK